MSDEIKILIFLVVYVAAIGLGFLMGWLDNRRSSKKYGR